MSKPEPTALIVDDDEQLQQLLSLGAEDAGFKTHIVDNIASAREWLGSNVPDLMLLDVMMPGGNGLDLLRWVKQQPKLSRIPIIVSSALKDDETRQDAIELDAVDFLRKPFTMAALKEKLEGVKRR